MTDRIAESMTDHMTVSNPDPTAARPPWRLRPGDQVFAYLAGWAFSEAVYSLLPPLTFAGRVVGIGAFVVLLFGIPFWLLARFVRHGPQAFPAAHETSTPAPVLLAASGLARRFYRRLGGPLLVGVALALVYAIVRLPANAQTPWVTGSARALMLLAPIGFVYWLGDRHR